MTASTHRLPPPLTEPLDRPEAMGRLGRRRRGLAERALGSDQPLMVLHSPSRVDTGTWLGARPVDVLVLRDRLVLLAPGKRPLLETLGFDGLTESTYNHVTGELLLAPTAGAAPKALRLPPVDAWQVLSQIHADRPGGPQGKEE